MELTRACLDRIEQTDSDVKAWTFVDQIGALKQADDCDLGAGPLAGIPLGIKDIFDVAGLPTTASSRVLSGNVATQDSLAVERLRKAGAIILGKTNTHEFAYGFVSAPTRNPWALDRIPGGSSGGSAAAAATSQCIGALGSDTGGSARVPPALCGVCGLKPLHGSIPIEGVIPLSPSLDVVGPIERTVEGVAILWEALSGQSAPLSPGLYTIGVPDFERLPDLDPEVEVAIRGAIAILQGMSRVEHDIWVPSFESFDNPRAAILMPEALETHRARGWWPEHSDLYTDETRTYLEFSESYFSPEIVEMGRKESRRLTAELLDAMNGVDALVTPTCPVPAPTVADAAEVEEGGLRRPVALTLGRIPGAVNVVGLAALTVPCGFTRQGLPIGLQIIGRDETTVLRIGFAYQNETTWTRVRPPLLDRLQG